jgi:hypothetical protein
MNEEVAKLLLEMENKIQHQCNWIRQAGHYYAWSYFHLMQEDTVHGRGLQTIFSELRKHIPPETPLPDTYGKVY